MVPILRTSTSVILSEQWWSQIVGPMQLNISFATSIRVSNKCHVSLKLTSLENLQIYHIDRCFALYFHRHRTIALGLV